jgi:outer membrane receptor protein involved in Fe transport
LDRRITQIEGEPNGFRKTRLAEIIAKLVGGTVLTATCVTATAIAQTVERVEVTGTRIKSPGIVSSSPISSIGSEEVLSSAPVVIEEVFRALPAAVPAIGTNTNKGSAEWIQPQFAESLH